PGSRHMVAKHRGAVGLGENRIGNVEPDLAAIDVPTGDKSNVLRAITTQVPVQQADLFVRAAILIMRDALNQRTDAIADTNDSYSYFMHANSPETRLCAVELNHLAAVSVPGKNA